MTNASHESPGGDIREAVIAGLACAGIAANLLLSRLPGVSPGAARAPLIVVVAAGALPLLADLARKILARDIGSDLLAGLSIVVSAAMGQWLVAAILVLMLSGGAALERHASRSASRVLEALARRTPSVAHVKRGDAVSDVTLDEISPGDVLLVFPHEICPVDGFVVEGLGAMDESYLTGEPFVISKAPGSEVLSGAINGDAALTIKASRRAVDSRYASIVRVLESAERNRPRLRRLADRLAAIYAPLTILLAGGVWAATGSATRMLSVLVVATPCPLIIAIPVAVIGAISLAARSGIIIKDPAVLEQVAKCRTVIVDKTGTLTYGQPALTEVSLGRGFTRSQVLRWAASLERYSRHPLAGPIVEAAAAAGAAHTAVDSVRERPGQGLIGRVDEREVEITGRRQAQERGLALPPAQTGLECVVLVDGAFAAALRFHDAPRPDSRPFLSHLAPTHGVSRVLMLSGDRVEEARYLAAQVGITEVEAGKSPEEKVAIVREETRRASTLFIGDGINDAPALAAATVGVAIGGRSDITSEAAGAVILTASVGKVDELIHIGQRMRSIALQSAVGGMLLSLLGMAAAAAGLLTPVEGAVLQEVIDLAAVLNAVRVALAGGEELSDYEERRA